ncbi:MAG: cyclic nucleotide-binding domain-containing protein [Cyanobacteria bacterium RI_101]|nr:cyclic nucleotide-binding domain-containing protein [Cyanobacteria bacterium RI_101]
MILTGCASAAQLQTLSVFQNLDPAQLSALVPFTYSQRYQSGEIIMNEGANIAPKLYGLISGLLEIKKTSPTTGKEAVIRLITGGDLFAASSIFGDSVAPATVLCLAPCQVLTIEREGLLKAIAHNTEISLNILYFYNQRLQQLHNTIQGLVAEKPVIRLVKLIQYYESCYGTYPSKDGNILNIPLTYDQISRSVGVSYEECVRLFKQLNGAVHYQRGGKIIIQDWQQLTKL